jgi:hypothetical protein
LNGGDCVDYIGVSQDKIGLVIGKGGDTIKSINQASGAFVEIDKKAPQDAHEKNFIIKGSKENVERAKQMVLEKIGAAPGSGYGAFPGQTFNPGQANGGGHGGFGGAPAAVPLHLPLVVRRTTLHSGLSTTGLRVCSRRQRILSASRRLKLLPIRLPQPKQLPVNNRRPLLPANLTTQHNGLNITGQLEK